MSNNKIVAVMVGLLFVLTMLAVMWTIQGNRLNNRLQEVNNQLGGVSSLRNVIAGTYNEAVNYSKTHPDIIPILQKMTNGGPQTVAPKTGGK